MQKMVVMKFTEPRIVPRPPIARPSSQRSPPTPGEFTALLSGAYANQPKDAAPPGVKMPAATVMPPKKNIQNPSMLSRGKATSGAPICRGMITFA